MNITSGQIASEQTDAYLHQCNYHDVQRERDCTDLGTVALVDHPAMKWRDNCVDYYCALHAQEVVACGDKVPTRRR